MSRLSCCVLLSSLPLAQAQLIDENSTAFTCAFLFTVLWLKYIVAAVFSGSGNASANTSSTDVVAVVEQANVQSIDGPGPAAQIPAPSAASVDTTTMFFRWKRVHANDNENIPMFMIITLVATTAANFESKAANKAVLAFVVLFTVFRLVHSACVIMALQPWRSVTFLGGATCTFVMFLIAVICCFNTINKFSQVSDDQLAPLNCLATFAFCFFIVWLLYLGTGIKSALIKPDNEKLQEDRKGSDNIPGVGGEMYKRFVRAHANAFENLPWFFIIALQGFGDSTHADISNATLSFIVLYCFFRICHFVALINSMQPFRTLFYIAAIVCLLAVCFCAMAYAGIKHFDATGGDLSLVSPSTQIPLAISVCFFFLFLKYLVSGVKSAHSKPAGDKLPEDVKDGGAAVADAHRHMLWTRAHANEYENTPFFFIAALYAASATAGFKSDDRESAIHAVTAFISLYTIFRFAHTFCMMLELQPFRSICWLIGVLCTLACWMIGIIGYGRALSLTDG